MDQRESLLDFKNPFNPRLLDEVVNKAYTSHGVEQKTCMELLNNFQNHPEAWNLVDQILERCELPQTKFIGLSILEKFIQTRWKMLPDDQKEAIKSFVINLLLKDASSEATLQAHKLYLKKLNLTIVELLKQEWPHKWPNFIPDLLASSRGNLSICENNMQILRYLSEEIYDFSEEHLTSNKIKYLKHQMEEEFQQVFQHCLDVLGKAQTFGLINSTLETLLRFLNWIPLSFVFQSELLNILVNRFLPTQEFRNLTVKCMTQVVCQDATPENNEKLLLLVNVVHESLKALIPIEFDLANVYDKLPNSEQEYIQNIAIFFTSFYEKHLLMAEKFAKREDHILIHEYLVKISLIDEREIFKINLEYWHLLLSGIFDQLKRLPMAETPLLNFQAVAQATPGVVPDVQLRKDIYATIMPQLRRVMIDSMVKPEEVLVVENEYGEVVRETQKETDTIALYKSMRECLVYLTHLDVYDTEQVMLQKLYEQFDEKNWDTTKLNRTCWSIGSISGAMHEEMEKKFLVSVIRDLLTLCEARKGKDNKAIVASNIMYTVGQYPRFLRNHWKFLRTVTNKLFEFMHERHEGVQDMACDTFDTLAQSCKRHFIVEQPDGTGAFIFNIINELQYILSDLQPLQKVSVYESIGHMISSATSLEEQSEIVRVLLSTVNEQWNTLINDPTILEDNERVKSLGYCLKTFSAVCRSVGPGFKNQLSMLFPSLLVIFKTCSEVINICINTQGPVAVKTPKVKNLRIVRKETLILLEVFISRVTETDFVLRELIPPLIENYLLSYQNSLPLSKEPEVLDLFSTCAMKLGHTLNSKVSDILSSVLQCTVEMIKDNFTEYPEIRISFYKLIHQLVIHCFEGVVNAGGFSFDSFMFTITYGFRHTMRDISETALTISTDIFKRVLSLDVNMKNSFYQAYMLSHLAQTMLILIDSQHKNGFHAQCILISSLLQAIENGAISCELNSAEFQRQPNMDNSGYVNGYLVALILSNCPQVLKIKAEAFVKAMQLYSSELSKFKLHVRDFLIGLKEFGSDNSDLYIADRELALAEKMKQEREAALQVPGLLKPSELPPAMED